MSDRSKQLKRIAALLRGESTLVLATVDERGEPCVAPLFYIVGDQLSLFWFSSPLSLHSRNLKRAPRASAAVFRHAESWKGIRGVQLRGSVTVITENMRRRALMKMYCKRFQLGAAFRLAIGRCKLYELRPDFLRYIDNSKGFGYKFDLTLAAGSSGRSSVAALWKCSK
jgi:uncharacterized protein YhbP (UPF0306 family)